MSTDNTDQIELPFFRLYVIDALESLSDFEYQKAQWNNGRDPGIQDNLDLVVHILYDDTQALPTPSAQIGVALFTEDVPALQKLADVLNPLIDDLGDSDDATYLADPKWASVVAAASDALDSMVSRGDVERWRELRAHRLRE